MNSGIKCLNKSEALKFLEEIFNKIYKKQINKVTFPTVLNYGKQWNYYQIDADNYHHRLELVGNMSNESSIKFIDFSDHDCLSYGFDNPFIDFYLTRVYQAMLMNKYGNDYDLVIDEINKQL